MKGKGGKILFWSSGIAGILILLAILCVGIKYIFTVRSGETAQIVENLSSTKEPHRLGEKFFRNTLVKIPWGKAFPKSGELLLPAGLQLAGEKKLSLRKLGFGYTLWEAVLPLQGYETGTTQRGISWNLIIPGGKDILLTFPAVTIEKFPLPDSRLAVASAYTPEKKQKKYPFYIGGAAFLLLIIGIIWSLLRKKNSFSPPIPPWEEAKCAISNLVEDVRRGKWKKERASAFLSDILSNYIEKRFSIPSTRLTGHEFLRALEKNSGVLQESQQHFLRKFLESSEMVKFAALPAGDELWERAAKDGELFIEETRPKSGEEQKEKKHE